MLRSAATKVMWVGRATVFLVGLAVILALVFGMATTAFGANNGNFILGKSNIATLVTRLAGPSGVDGPMFEVQNRNVGANDTALSLKVDAGEPPMQVNSGRTVTNLSADRVDGRDSTQFLPAQTYVVEQDEAIEPPVIGSSHAILCDDGDVPISGGFGSLDPETQIIASRRFVLGDRDAWLVAVRTSGSDAYTVQAVCADLPPARR